MAAELELGVDALRERLEAQLSEARCRPCGERLPPELGERLAAPQRERPREQLGAARGFRCGPRALGELLEALEVRGDASQRVAGATGLDRVGAQGLP